MMTLICWALLLLICIIQSESKRFGMESSFQRKLRDNEYSIFSLAKGGSSPVDLEREQLYEAYNLLHTLAQDFHKPFDAPAVIVVGHQTSGKSALIEAIMGFQFNQVGGGTKTRRPIALRMQYNPNCVTPLCFLTLENGKEEQRSLPDIQAYIEAENKRLEKDPSRSFDPREINIRMEYKYCPNMIMIDTPGMIHPPKGRNLTPQQRALAQAAREAEALVLSKIRCQDYIILCVEDTTDWKHSTTRNIVMQADPQLARTVLVSTKLDTKLPQFSEPEDLDDFLRAPLINQLFAQMMGGPFFTSVPSGRVGMTKDFESNEDFVDAIHHAERNDRDTVLAKLGSADGRASLQCVGVSRLRSFLEARVEDCYRRNVAKIVPLLQSELRMTESKLSATEAELNALSLDRLRQTANEYRELFSKELANVIQGTVRVSPQEWGETLEMEQVRGGGFLMHQFADANTAGGGIGGSGVGSASSASSSSSVGLGDDRGDRRGSAAIDPRLFSGMRVLTAQDWQHLAMTHVAHAQAKLFGGAQYHRAMKEFALAVRHLRTPTISEDEIANAAGMGETHNGVNFMRAACVIAMEKARLSFDPALDALALRTQHIMKRLFPIVQHLVRSSSSSSSSTSSMSASSSLSSSLSSIGRLHPSPVHLRPFQDLVRRVYDRFVDETLRECLVRCKDDVSGMTEYVTFEAEERGGGGYGNSAASASSPSLASSSSNSLYSSLPTPRRVAEIWQMAVDRRQQELQNESLDQDEDMATEEEIEDEGVDNEGGGEDSSMSAKIVKEWSQANGGSRAAVKKSSTGKQSNSNKKEQQKLPHRTVLHMSKSAAVKRKEQRQQQINKQRSPVTKKRSSTTTATTSNEYNGINHNGINPNNHNNNNQQLVTMPIEVEEDAVLSDYYRVVQLTEEMVSGSSATRTSALVTAIVEYIVSAWRMYFARTTAMKFNSFFLMAFIKRFPNYLREEVDKIYQGDLADLFDMAETRRILTLRRDQLLAEAEANNRLQERFDAIAEQLRVNAGTSGSNSVSGSSSGIGSRNVLDDSMDSTAAVAEDMSSSSVDAGEEEGEGGSSGAPFKGRRPRWPTSMLKRDLSPDDHEKQQ